MSATSDEREPLVHALQGEPDKYMFWCPGCECGHWFQTNGKPQWTFNGDRFDKPTVAPSIRVRGGKHGSDYVCHLYLTDGKILFLPDCSHALKGQTVMMEPFP